MKEGLEKYFQQGVTEPDKIPEVQAEIPFPEGIETVPQEQEVQQEVVPQEQDAPAAEQTIEQPSAPTGLEDITAEKVEELSVQQPQIQEKQIDLPENVNKLVDFLNDNPGASMQDYVNLNKSYDDYDDKAILKEYYKQSKPHLDKDDISFTLKKKFDIDPELLDEEEVRERNIALKEELHTAKHHLNARKDKYYAELKASVGNAAENKEQQAIQEEATKHFQSETNKLFEGFNGFTFDLGDGNKKRYKVENPDKLRDYQSDLNNVVGDYLTDGKLTDPTGYHKGLFAMKNPDKIAQLFYEQGKADAIKAQTQDSKNIDFSHTHRAPDSNTKLKPGQARELNPETSSNTKVNLKYWKK